MTESRILFCWELGSGSGHLTGLLRVADAFVEQGTECFFAIPETTALVRHRPNWQTRTNVHVFQAPVWEIDGTEASSSERTYTFADVLSAMGFSNGLRVEGNVARWDTIIDQARPTSIVAEFSPGVLIAARGRIPCIVFGNGYYVLPDVDRLPSMTAWQPEIPESSIRREAEIGKAIQRSRQRRRLPRLEALSQSFRGDHTMVCSFRSLDPYRASRNERTYCPFNIVYPKCSMETKHAQRTFVYFSFPHPIFERLLELLISQSTYPCDVYAPPYVEQLLPYQGVHGHHIFERPLDLNRICDYSSCVHHGGMGIASTCAVARIPQLVVPVQLEHAITAQSLSQQEAALMCLPEIVAQWKSPEPLVRGLGSLKKLPMKLQNEFDATEENATKALALIQSLCC